MILRINKLNSHKEMLPTIFLDLSKKEKVQNAVPHPMPFVFIAINTQILAMYFYVLAVNYIIRHVRIKTIDVLYANRNKMYPVNNSLLKNSNLRMQR